MVELSIEPLAMTFRWVALGLTVRIFWYRPKAERKTKVFIKLFERERERERRGIKRERIYIYVDKYRKRKRERERE